MTRARHARVRRRPLRLPISPQPPPGRGYEAVATLVTPLVAVLERREGPRTAPHRA